jgi:plastocyanin
MRRIVLLMAVAAVVLVGTPFVVSATGADKHPTARAQKHPTRTVLIQNFRFKPAQITIKRGTRVRWVNRDRSAHTATATKGSSFDSGRLGPGQRYSYTFRAAGKKRYYCKIHPSMRGSIVVRR